MACALSNVVQGWAKLSNVEHLPYLALFLDNFDRQADPSAAPQEVGRCVLQERFCLGHGTFQAVGAACLSLASVAKIFEHLYSLSIRFNTHTHVYLLYINTYLSKEV